MLLDGVAGTGAPIRLEFLEPGGGKTGRLLPTGHAVDEMAVEGLAGVSATLVDAANPCVFVAASDLGKSGTELPQDLEADAAFMSNMARIRYQAPVDMGLAGPVQAAARIQAIPKIGVICRPRAYASLV